jgi:VanZ family protein
MGIIFYFSSKPAYESDAQSFLAIDVINHTLKLLGVKAQFVVGEWNFFIRKFAHASEYAFLGVLLYIAFSASCFTKVKTLIFSLIISIIYASTDEVHQLFVPGRTGKVMDVMIDTGGALAGLLFIIGIRSVWTKLNKNGKR